MKYKISLCGAGGELWVGNIRKEVFNYFKNEEMDHLERYINGEVSIPEEIKAYFELNIETSGVHEFDNIAHTFGLFQKDGSVFVVEENNEEVYTTKLEDEDIELFDIDTDVNENSKYILAKLNDFQQPKEAFSDANRCIFYGLDLQKGCFGEYEINIKEEFDKNKLSMSYCFYRMPDEVVYDGSVSIIREVLYDGKVLEELGGIATSGVNNYHWMCDLGPERFEVFPEIGRYQSTYDDLLKLLTGMRWPP